jgi:arylsulfatase A-like enzyme
MMGCIPPEDWQGVSLLPTIGETETDTERRVYSEVPNHAAMFGRDLKHIHNRGPLMTHRKKTLDRIESYDLGEDPRETRNLVHDMPGDATGEVERMTQALDLMIELRKGEGSIENTNLDPEAVRELQALGYLQ